MHQFGSLAKEFDYKWGDARRKLSRLDQSRHCIQHQNLCFFTDCKVGKRRKSGEVVDFVVNVMDVTQGQRDINLHVISKIVIEWIQKWHAVVCCCRVTSLSSGVCVLARVCVCDTERECALYARVCVCVYRSVKTSSVAAGVKVAEAVNSTHSLILSHFLSHSFIFLFL